MAPENRPALYGLARLYAGRGEWRRAEGFLERLLELDPEAAVVWGTLASVRVQLGKIDGAQEALDRAALRLTPDHPQVLELQARLEQLRAGREEGS